MRRSDGATERRLKIEALQDTKKHGFFIRFKDENGNDYPNWVEKTLGEIAVFLKGKNISKVDIQEGGMFECIRYGELYTDYNEVIREIKSKTNLEEENLVFSNYNDVIIPSSGETQIDIAKASCVLKDNVALGGDLNIIRSELNGIYLSYFLNHVRQLDIAKLAQGNAVVHLYANQLKTLRVSIPVKEEQDKIADFLMTIEDKIDFTSNQIQNTRQYKQALLQQLFN